MPIELRKPRPPLPSLGTLLSVLLTVKLVRLRMRFYRLLSWLPRW